MSRPLIARLAAGGVCSACRMRIAGGITQSKHHFSTTPSASLQPSTPTFAKGDGGLDLLLDQIRQSPSSVPPPEEEEEPQSYFFHVYATKHNTHITVCRPDKSPLPGLSLSAGNLGFRKSNRGTYDAAYQLAAYTISRLIEKGLLNDIKKMEIILRGFGTGREAVTKVILGTEGERIRGLITQVTDATRVKFGGTRSEKPRRLG